jgi:hypothetical protein
MEILTLPSSTSHVQGSEHLPLRVIADQLVALDLHHDGEVELDVLLHEEAPSSQR